MKQMGSSRPHLGCESFEEEGDRGMFGFPFFEK
jgi:hypothetical protein